MNTFNALGFLALGSLMNALPVLAPAMAARGPEVMGMTTSALWLHFMGLVVGMIGGSWLLRVSYQHAMEVARAARRVAVPQTAPAREMVPVRIVA
jgi:hypothetical protein